MDRRGTRALALPGPVVRGRRSVAVRGGRLRARRARGPHHRRVPPVQGAAHCDARRGHARARRGGAPDRDGPARGGLGRRGARRALVLRPLRVAGRCAGADDARPSHPRDHGGPMSHAVGRDAAFTRSRLLRTALAGGAAVAGGAALGAHRGDGGPFAAASPANDRKILGLFLLIEQAQEAYYRRAVEQAKIDGELLELANTVVDQEAAHITFLEQRLGGKARPFTLPDPGPDAGTRHAFLENAVAVEELAIAAYVGQSAALSRPLIARIGEMTSVEARQAAWLRDIAGTSPAPRAADPARPPRAVTADLRRRRF